MKIKWLQLCIYITACTPLLALQESSDTLYEPIIFTNDGFQTFLQKTYNHPLYASHVLPHSFFHLIQFLNHGNTTKQPRTYTKSVFRLFSNKLKSTRYVNPTALIDLLHDLPQLLEYQFIIFKPDQYHQIRTTINEILYDSFLQKYNIFEENPSALFDSISHDIVETLKSEAHLFDDISMDELRHMILTFLELSINKLVWSPQDKAETWASAKSIANQLEKLMEYNIITDPDDLNDLYISLIERYCTFLDLMQDHMATEVYVDIKLDIENNRCSLLDLESPESCLLSKIDRILYTLDASEAQARSREYTTK